MKTIKIHTLHCGKALIDRSVPFYEKLLNPIAYTGFLRGERHKMVVPVSAYLIEHPRGVILIDTGWHSAVRTHPQKHLGPIHYLVNKPYQMEGEAINEQLNRLGYQDSDIDFLIFTHLHTDHVSGLKLIPGVKKILVSEPEWKQANSDKLVYRSKFWKGLPMNTFKYSNTGIGPEGLSYDLFDDDSLVIISTPGHTNGLCSVMIRNKEGKFVLMCSDVGYAKKSWEEMILPGITTSKTKAKNALAWVRQMSEQTDCVAVIANHDTELQPHTIEL